VLRPELSAAVAADRFLLEIRTTARLNHPNILPLLDSGQAGDVVYYVMPHVGGRSLRDLIRREAPLPVDEAVRITTQVASALEHAHRNEVIHRDVKPENILMHEGVPMVADFGIALAVSAAGTDRITDLGFYLGTPIYMSPEQASGDRDLDGRSDVYSLGCVLYEMLAGEPPFSGANPRAVMARHVRDAVPPLATVRPDLPRHIDRAVLRALAKEPKDRHPTAQSLADALVDEAVTPLPSTGASIAVLPFANMSTDRDDEFLSDGIAEEIINALSKIEGLQVAARTSSFAFKGKHEDVRAIGSQLNVGSVLEGSVRRSGNRLRVTAQLVNCADGYHLWSERYDREMSDVFAVQDDIAEAIVTVLRGSLLAGERESVAKRHTEHVGAYQLYLKGRYVENTRTPDGFTKGIEYFEEALRTDDDYALAYAGLADTYYLLGWYRHLPPREAFPRADAAAARALELDETVAEAHISRAYVKFYYDWDWVGAERCFRRALELNPNHATALHGYAEYLAARGRIDEALLSVQRAHELDPLSLTISAGLGWVHFFSRHYGEAAEHFEATLALDPHYVFIHWFLGQTYLMQERLDDAIAVLRRGLAGSKGHPGMSAYLGHACARAGRLDPAHTILRELEEHAMRSYVPADYFAVLYIGLGEADEAVAWLEKAYDERALHLVFLAVDPVFDDLRGDPRFDALLEKVGLAPARGTSSP
jgi:serine/threonine-protein kinase